MTEIPDYVGPMAMGLKMGVILPDMDIVEKLLEPLRLAYDDGLLDDGDVLCVTESIVARAQNNYLELEEVSDSIKKALDLPDDGTVGVVFPITSRNRFSMILESIARAVPEGKVIVQFSYPCDEVGNQVISPEFTKELNKDLITADDIEGKEFKHPITEVNYIEYYKEIINGAGPEGEIILCNDPQCIARFDPDGVIAADIHTREHTKKAISKKVEKCITLDDICTEGKICSKWGLLGSNMSSGGRLKLAPRNGEKVVNSIQKRVKEELGVTIEVIIYGDGAYKDPTSGIYELADPEPAVASTDGLDHFRRGVKYKYLADKYHYEEGKDEEEIIKILEKEKKKDRSEDCMEKEGTTPRRMEDLLGSLADLVSGSSDAGTPVVLVKNFLD